MSVVRIDPVADAQVQRAVLAVIQTFRELAGPAYASLGYPLVDDVAAADALVGSLLEGLVNRYGVEAVRVVVERVIVTSESGAHVAPGEPALLDTETGRVRGGG